MAVIGKVGTYATVQPIQGPDFGKMVQDQFDKADAEKKAKSMAASKAKEDALKDRKSPDAFTPSGMIGYDESISKVYKDIYNDAMSYKQKYIETSDNRYLYEHDRLVNELETITNESKALNNYLTNAEKLFQAGRVNESNYNEVMYDLNQFKDNKAKYTYKDGRAYVQIYDENGNEREPKYIGGFVKDQLNLVADVNLNDEFKKVVDRVEAPLIESGNYYSNVKITDINSREASAQREALLSAAKGFTGDDAAMTKWYQANVKPTTGIRKTNNWTDKEREDATKYFYNEMAKSYGKKVERGFGSPNTGGSGSDNKNEIAKPTVFTVPGTSTKGLAWSAANKNNPTISSLVVNVGGDKTKKETINNSVFKNMYMTKSGKGNQFVNLVYSMPTGSESKTYTKEDVDDIEATLRSLSTSSPAYNETKKELELAKKSLSGNKQSQQRLVVIPVEDESNLGNIANALQYDSTDSLLSDLRNLAGFNNRAETIEERKRRLGLK